MAALEGFELVLTESLGRPTLVLEIGRKFWKFPPLTMAPPKIAGCGAEGLLMTQKGVIYSGASLAAAFAG